MAVFRDPSEGEESGATRPSIPVLVWLAAAVWFGVVVAEWVMWHRYPAGGMGVFWLIFAASVCVLAGLISWRSGWGLTCTLIMSGIVAGLVSGCVFWANVGAASRLLSDSAVVVSEAVVVGDPIASKYGATVPLRLTTEPWAGVVVSGTWVQGKEPPQAGRVVSLRGAVREKPSRDEWARRSHRKGESGRLRLWDAKVGPWANTPVGYAAEVRRGLLLSLRGLSGEGARLLEGVLLGDRSALRGSALEEDFRTCGLSHLLAVSGTHLAIVAYLVGQVVSHVGFSRKWQTAVVLAICAGYVALTGAQVSSVRSFVMGMIAGAAPWVGRRHDGLGALAVAVIALLVISPAQAFDPGLMLSVSAVAGLILFGSLATEWATAAMPRVAHPAAPALSTTLVAQVATAPVAVPLFSMFSIIGPVANIIAIPLVTAGLSIGLIGAALYLVWSPVGNLVLRCATLPLSVTASVAQELARLPYAAIPLTGSGVLWGAVAAVIGGTLWGLWPKPPNRRFARAVAVLLISSLVLAAFGLPAPDGAYAVVLDVGQGDAILLSDGASAVLVDTGPNPGVLRRSMAEHGIRNLDAVLITHDHADHSGGLSGLLGVVKVGALMIPDTADQEDFGEVSRIAQRLGAPVSELSQGACFRVGEIQCKVLWPPASWSGEEVNDSSVIVLAVYKGRHLLLSGDAETGPHLRLISQGLLGRVDVLKVAHHGSDGAVDDELLSVLRPAVAIVSVGESNDYGHPAPATLDALRRVGARVIRTDRAGDVTVRLDSGRIEVKHRHGVCDNALGCAIPPDAWKSCTDQELRGCPRTLVTSNLSTSSLATRSFCLSGRSSDFKNVSPKRAGPNSTSMYSMVILATLMR